MSAMFQGAFRKKNIHRMKTWCPEFGEFEVGHILSTRYGKWMQIYANGMMGRMMTLYDFKSYS